MINNKTRKMMLLIFSILIVFLFTMCDDFKDETLKPNATDAYAIEALQDTGMVDLMLAIVDLDTNVNKYTAKYNNIKDTLSADYSSVLTQLQEKGATVTTGKTHYNILIAKGKDNSVLLPITSAKEVVVYTTGYVDVQVYDAIKTAMDNDATYEAELAAGYFEYDPNLTSDYPKPIVKTRNAFDLTAGTYVLNIRSTEATLKTTLSLVVAEKQ